MKKSVIILALCLSLPAFGQIRWPWQKAQPAPAAKPAAPAARPPAPAVNRPPMAAPAPAPKGPVAAPAPQGGKNAPQPAKNTPAPPVKNPAPVAGRGPVPVGSPARPVKAPAHDGKPSAQPVSHARRAPQHERRHAELNRTPADKSNAGKPVEKSAAAPKVAGKGQRDPFVSPVVEHVRGGSTCRGTGRQCLEVGEITLSGIVRSGNGNIAVVTTGDHTYFLHENDPLANGSVERINRDSIVLREHFTDDFGRTSSREVTRKIGTPAG